MDGAHAHDPLTIFAGTTAHGFWRTTDGGDNWVKADTGAGADQLDGGRNWSTVVDFSDANIVYTTSGYGEQQGIWKSINGGVDFVNIGLTLSTNDISQLTMDPLDHQHVIATGHSAPYDIFETLDGGETWTTHHPPFAANTFIFFLGQDDSGAPSSQYILGLAENNGLWRTTTGGRIDGIPDAAAWTQVSSELGRSHAGGGLYRAANGALYAGVNSTIGRSADNGRTWEDLSAAGNLPSSCDAYSGIVGDGERIWSMLSNTGQAACGPYSWFTTPEDGDGRTWTQYNDQTFHNGPKDMLFDPTRRVVYANLWCSGIWRLQLP